MIDMSWEGKLEWKGIDEENVGRKSKYAYNWEVKV